MKKYLTTVFLSGFLMAGAKAQDLKTANVPKAVTAALLAKYPESAKYKVAWEKEKGNYEANWGGKSGEDNSAVFTPTASFIELVQAIAINKLPAKALAYIKTNKSSVKVTEAGLVIDAKGIVTYEAEIKGGQELIFDKDGNFIKRA